MLHVLMLLITTLSRKLKSQTVDVDAKINQTPNPNQHLKLDQTIVFKQPDLNRFRHDQNQNRTACGYTPTSTSPCDEQCIMINPTTGVCEDSCGHTCTVDVECGAWPFAPCSACVRGSCTGEADFGNCTQQQPRLPSDPRIPPILPFAWNASFSMTNYTNPTSPPQLGFMWYDDSVRGLRQDFNAPCPFIELQSPFRNNGSCSILFFQGYNYYIYLEEQTCCQYKFPNWRPNSYVVGNASYGGTDTIQNNSVKADHWKFEYTCPWTRPEPAGYPRRLLSVTVQRDVWTRVGTNVPVRMNETLTSGVSDFTHVLVGPQDTPHVFDQLLDKFECLASSDVDPTLFYKTCNKYNARGRLSTMGYE